MTETTTTPTLTTRSVLAAAGWRVLWAGAVLAAAPLVAGCAKTPAAKADAESAERRELQRLGGEVFRPDDEPRTVTRLFDAQSAAGARADATLRAAHFDGGNPSVLNSLGEEKLDLMLGDDDALPLVVYVDVPKDDASAARQRAVEVYLRDRGLAADQVKVVAGANPRTSTPTAPKLKDMQAAAAAPAPSTGNASGGAAGGSGMASGK
ncbi:MAG TPA: hypothetical protein VF796_06640 [Humisphaera sp.]